MGDRDKFVAGSCAGDFQPLPQIFRVGAVIAGVGDISCTSLRVPVGKNNPVQISATRSSGPLPADNRGKFTGLIKRVGNLRFFAPGVPHNLLLPGQ